MLMRTGRVLARQGLLCAGVSVLALSFTAQVALAQTVDVGTVQGTVAIKKKKKAPVVVQKPVAAPAPVAAAPAPAPTGPAITSNQAIGSAAPAGSAPALAVSQGSLTATQPGSIVSNKVLQDIAQPSSDYNEALKYTPGFSQANPNGSLGDAKSSWRGFKDGQFNITYDGVAFGDANNPSHHSAAYFPGYFIGTSIVDRGPGAASQVGYAPFGGTLSLISQDFTDKAGGSIAGSAGSFGTYTGGATIQSGLVGGNTHALLQTSYQKTDGALDLGHVDTTGVLFKLDRTFGDVKATVFGTYSLENYNNTNQPNWAQLQAFGPSYGTINNTNPKSDAYVDYNNSKKQTDMEYLNLEGKHGGWQWDNKVYTYAYEYPDWQNNPGITTGDNASATIANGQTLNSFKVVNPGTACSTGVICTTTVKFGGVVDGDVVGFKQLNNLRGYGDIFNLKHDVNAGLLSGQFRTGIWAERVDNFRHQEYYDFTQQKWFTQLGPTTVTTTPGTISTGQQAYDAYAAGFKLFLDSHITNYQPYVEYEWKPTNSLSITPGLKYESINRTHLATVNQTTLQPANFSQTYTATLPQIAARYKVNENLNVYAQAATGFLIPDVAAFYVFDPNKNAIAPQQTVNYQIGTTFKNKNWTFSADAYHVTATNFTLNLLDPTDNKTVIGLINAGTAQYKGVEAEGTYAFGNGLALTASGSMGSAMFVDGPNVGLTLPDAPKYTLAGGVIYDDKHFFGSVLHKITGDQFGTGGQTLSGGQSNEINHIAAWDQTDVVAGIRTDSLKKLGLGDSVEFKLGVNNLFDKRAYTELGGAPKGTTDATAGLTYTTQAGRNIYAGVKVNF
jgi:iron complex outermembrane recepter protein